MSEGLEVAPKPMHHLCDGSLGCTCPAKRKAEHKAERAAAVFDAHPLTQYRRGVRTPEAKAANTEYHRMLRARRATS